MLVGFENDSKRQNKWMNEWMNELNFLYKVEEKNIFFFLCYIPGR